ncbi:MAG: hypothetical protein NTV01_05145 [Bacteroidia bacterium]|nr:hypothetical protein [Bacteroidia bacterium]
MIEAKMVFIDQDLVVEVNMGDNHGFDIQPPFPEIIYGFECIGIVRSLKIGPDFFPFIGPGI